MENPKPSLETLPQAVANLAQKISELKELILSTNKQPKQSDQSEWLNVQQLIEYVPDAPARATVYDMVHKRAIPFHKSAKKLRFKRTEIDAWLNKGKTLTNDEIDAETDKFLAAQKIKRSSNN